MSPSVDPQALPGVAFQGMIPVGMEFRAIQYIGIPEPLIFQTWRLWMEQVCEVNSIICTYLGVWNESNKYFSLILAKYFNWNLCQWIHSLLILTENEEYICFCTTKHKPRLKISECTSHIQSGSAVVAVFVLTFTQLQLQLHALHRDCNFKVIPNDKVDWENRS